MIKKIASHRHGIEIAEQAKAEGFRFLVSCYTRDHPEDHYLYLFSSTHDCYELGQRLRFLDVTTIYIYEFSDEDPSDPWQLVAFPQARFDGLYKGVT